MIVKDFNGIDCELGALQQSYRRYPHLIHSRISDTGAPYLLNCMEEHKTCGCIIEGNGTLQFPLRIKYCKAHEAVQVQ